MQGWCPYKDGTLKETECHHDGYCSDCPYEFSEKMRILKELYVNDEEAFYSSAENLMCEVLRELGYGKGIDIYEIY